MDVQVTFNSDTGTADWSLLNNDVAQAQSDLLSAVMLMLFTDARCDDSFLPSDGDRRGWWGSSYEPYPIGSKLWQLDRAKFAANTNLLLQARDYTKAALQPFIDQSIAKSISVQVSKVALNAINIAINMTKPDNSELLAANFQYAWAQLA